MQSDYTSVRLPKETAKRLKAFAKKLQAQYPKGVRVSMAAALDELLRRRETIQ